MKTEIEKLMQNAGIRYINLNACKINETDKDGKCEIIFYPDFTTEKQLSLIKWLAKIYEVSINWRNHHNSYRFVIRDYRFNGRKNHSVCLNDVNLEETLATVINKIWQDLTDAEKAEIKRILE